MTTSAGHVTRVTIPLRYRDLDTLGHLNQAVYHVFLEQARATLVQELLETEGVAFVLARVELDHRHEVRWADREVHVDAWIERVGSSSVVIGSRITTPGGVVAAEGSTVLVGWDAEARGKRILGDAERAALEGGRA